MPKIKIKCLTSLHFKGAKTKTQFHYEAGSEQETDSEELTGLVKGTDYAIATGKEAPKANP